MLHDGDIIEEKRTKYFKILYSLANEKEKRKLELFKGYISVPKLQYLIERKKEGKDIISILERRMEGLDGSE